MAQESPNPEPLAPEVESYGPGPVRYLHASALVDPASSDAAADLEAEVGVATGHEELDRALRKASVATPLVPDTETLGAEADASVEIDLS